MSKATIPPNNADFVTFHTKYGPESFALSGTPAEKRAVWGQICVYVVSERLAAGWYGVPLKKLQGKPKPPPVNPNQTTAEQQRALDAIKAWEAEREIWLRDQSVWTRAKAASEGDTALAISLVNRDSDDEYGSFSWESFVKIPSRKGKGES